ncbi:Histone H3-like centromeric protein cse-4 [Atta colombica]|uniref:Histone H3-like centromeric protein cse-4 n=1 Tax=Atta colombica TaxID=520822 RepID=A0A195AVJ5_9HYME|nr:Histone H3-like centromeric protein cse-4 [Atta colombica]
MFLTDGLIQDDSCPVSGSKFGLADISNCAWLRAANPYSITNLKAIIRCFFFDERELTSKARDKFASVHKTQNMKIVVSPERNAVRAGLQDRTTIIVSKHKRKSHVLQEIKHLRRTTHFVIPKLSFARLVREIIIDIFPRKNITRIQATALEALQEATEMYLVQFFEDAVLLALHTKRVRNSNSMSTAGPNKQEKKRKRKRRVVPGLPITPISGQ